MTDVNDLIRLMKQAGIARGKADSLAPDRSLEEQGLDSYDRMSLLSELEEHFNSELSNEQANQLKTLNDIVNYFNADGQRGSEQ